MAILKICCKRLQEVNKDEAKINVIESTEEGVLFFMDVMTLQHENASEILHINFCPFCGTKLGADV